MSIIIGVSPDTHDGRKLKVRTPYEKILYLWSTYLQAFLDNSATAVILPVTADKKHIKTLCDRLDGFVVAGGNFDVPPEFFGEKPKPYLGKIKIERSNSELAVLLEAMKRDMPVLGICGGEQLINVAMGGTLYQDIKKERPESNEHQQKNKKDTTSHQVKVIPGTKLFKMMGGKGKAPLKVRVNSTHHQAVKDVADRCIASAIATDGIVEAVESKDHRFIVGIQWHPELLYLKMDSHAGIIKAFVKAASKSKGRR